jgi:hypothetical protein
MVQQVVANVFLKPRLRELKLALQRHAETCPRWPAFFRRSRQRYTQVNVLGMLTAKGFETNDRFRSRRIIFIVC